MALTYVVYQIDNPDMSRMSITGQIPKEVPPGYAVATLTTAKSGRLSRNEELYWDGRVATPSIRTRPVIVKDKYQQAQDDLVAKLGLDPVADSIKIQDIQTVIDGLRVP